MLNTDRVRAPIQRIMRRLVLTALLMIITETIGYTAPVDGESYSALSCCSIHEDKERVSRAVRVDRMIQCVNSSSAYTRTIQDESVVYAMFASPEVYSYAAHATMVNGAFFEYKGYAARLLSAETGDDFYPKDRRWNKVKAVARALNEGSGWASKTKALVSIDTDLIVLDWDLSVEEILDSHPHADLILSADALDIGNTGFLIIRNTAWAVSFFEEWWDSRFMKHTFCDQHVLNKLYASLKKKGEAQKVAILDSTTVNSRWPAIETMEKEDRVLHLMGETVPYRAAVATHASSVTCSAYRQFQTEGGCIGSDGAAPIDLKGFYDSYLPSQLAFSQARLVQLARGALAAEREEQRRRAASPLAKETDIQRLHAANTNACDDKRPYLSNSHAECEGFFQQEYQLIRAALRAQSSVVGQEGLGDDTGDFKGKEGVGIAQIEQIEGEMAASNRSSTYKMFLMDHLAKTLYNVVFFSPRERKRAAAARVLSALQSMKKEVDMNNPVNQIYLLHKEALIHSQLASYYYSIEDWGTCLDDSRVAINAITDVLAICEEKSPDFAGYVLEYVDMASQASEAFFHLQQYEEALEWAQAALKNAEVLFNTFRGEERVIARDLARLHSLMAKMLIYNPQVEKYLDLAEKQLKLARMSKLTFDVEHALPTHIKDDLIELSEMIVKKRKEEATSNM